MRAVLYICTGLILASCTSNTIYKKPENLIPKDSMVMLLTDMYIASSAKNQKNKFLKREQNYMGLIYEKFKIDSTRFDVSNTYYTSKVDEYTDILKKVKLNIDALDSLYRKEQSIKDSLRLFKNKGTLKKDSLLDEKRLLQKLPKQLNKKDLKKVK